MPTGDSQMLERWFNPHMWKLFRVYQVKAKEEVLLQDFGGLFQAPIYSWIYSDFIEDFEFVPPLEDSWFAPKNVSEGVQYIAVDYITRDNQWGFSIMRHGSCDIVEEKPDLCKYLQTHEKIQSPVRGHYYRNVISGYVREIISVTEQNVISREGHGKHQHTIANFLRIHRYIGQDKPVESKLTCIWDILNKDE